MTVERYLVPAREARTELKVVNSRFIASAAPAFSVEEAKVFIARVRKEFSDASHNVPAYIIGHGSSTISHCNDDGEPSGTAGRPALAVLQGSGLGDIVVVYNPLLRRYEAWDGRAGAGVFRFCPFGLADPAQSTKDSHAHSEHLIAVCLV